MSSNFRSPANITDPSDWKTSQLPQLSELDSLQRCYICKEFFKAPVITSCNHTFCSQCIREYLITNNLCPLCKTELFESNLKRDILLEEIVTCFSGIRPHLHRMLEKQNVEVEQTPEQSSPPPVIPSDDVIEISDEEEPKKKRKIEESIPENDDVVSCPICSEQMTAEVLQTKHIDDCLSGKKPKRQVGSRPSSINSKRSKSGIASFFKPAESRASSPAEPKPLGHVNFYINETSKHSTDTKKLPKLDYSSLTTPRLKEKLASLKLPTQGTRGQLELRYNQYYVLFNSNLDSNRPSPEKMLKQKLKQWEASHSSFNVGTGDLFSSRSSLSNRSINDKNFSVKEWLDAYGDIFRELISQARASMKKEKDTTGAGATEGSEGTVEEESHSNPEPTSQPVPPNSKQEDGGGGEFDFKSAIAQNPLFSVPSESTP